MLFLFQVALPYDEIKPAILAISEIASQYDAIQTKALRYNYNGDEGSFEILYDKTSELTALQRDVIGTLYIYIRIY
jgi:hypothetical protein